MPKKEIFTEIEGRKLKLSNLKKPLFPELGIVKAEIIEYYIKIAPYILPHLKNRPLTLIRYPDGIQSNRFYAKNRPNWTPEWIECFSFEEDDNTYVMANDLPSLVWMANLAALELHPMQTKAMSPTKPDHFIFDLDPPESTNFQVVKELALRLKPFLESYGYRPFVKTSGSKGLHIYVPIHPVYEQSVVLETIKYLAKLYVRSDKITTLKINKEKRQGKILLDIYRNHKSQTCVAPYSMRGEKGAPISAPLYWDELKDIETPQVFTIKTIFDKLSSDGNPWKEFSTSATFLYTDNTNNLKAKTTKSTTSILKGKKAAIEEIDLKPMLAILGQEVPSKNKYSYEIKWDGIRIIVMKDGAKVKIMSRKGNNLTEKFPQIHSLIRDQATERFILDGELLIMNPDGTPNFSKVVGRMHLNGTEQILRNSKNEKATLYLFDVLYFNDNDIRRQPLEDRRNWLENNIQWSDSVRFSETFEDGQHLLDAVRARNMEGIMCKLKGSIYESNKRSISWLKIKVQNEDIALIIGYTKGKGGRSRLFGALHLAKYKKGSYVYHGKVGTGFNAKRMKEIIALLFPVDIIAKPIKETVEDEKNTVWIEAKYSCKLKYASMSSNETFREPVFLSIFKTKELSKDSKHEK